MAAIDVHDERHSRRTRARLARRSSPRRLIRGPRTIEAYLRANSPPRYMQRLREIESEYQFHRLRLEDAYRALKDACGHDLDLFSDLWQAEARGWPFEELNELIREHNQWYPVEVDLPMDPRTRDYVPIRGASFRRIELGPEWVLEHFPPWPRDGAGRPRVPARAPREAL